MSGVKIEKGVPICSPAFKPRKPHKSKYPWRGMEIGDSFLVIDPPKNFGQQVHNQKMIHGKKFIYRSTPEGIRVWRTE